MPVKNAWTERIEQLEKDNTNVLRFLVNHFRGCPYDKYDVIVRPGECTNPGKDCHYEDSLKECWMIYINKKEEE